MGDTAVVLAVDSASTTACLRSLGCQGVHTIAASEDETVPGFASRYADETVVTPAPAEDLAGYADSVLALARRPGVEAILPTREEDVYVLSKHRSAFEPHVTTLWPPFETLERAHDRVRLVEAARSVGVSVPETQLLSEVDDWDQNLIVKGRYAVLAPAYVDGLSGQAHDVASPRYLEPGIEPDREALVREFGHVPIVQEYVPGDEHSLWALYDRGEPVLTCQMHQHRAWKYPGGTSTYRETVADPDLEAAGRAVLDELDWHGFASVQFMRDEQTGEFRLMEVNPRVWASVPCAVRAGADFPRAYWQLANGAGGRVDGEYETGFATHRLRGEAVYLYSVLAHEHAYVDPPPFGSSLREVLASLSTQPHFDYLTLDDPGPFVRDVWNTVPVGAAVDALSGRLRWGGSSA